MKISNSKMGALHKKNYEEWKKKSLNNSGYFVIFKGFIDSGKLKNISGNALKLYVYFGLYSDNYTGEVWHSIKTMSEYFNKS